MSKGLKIVIIAAFLTVIVFGTVTFFNFKNENITSELFTVKDTSDISKILITQAEKKVKISKNESSWTIDDKYPANKKAIRKLFLCLTESKISKPVVKAKEDSVISEIKSKGKTITIYNPDNKIIKKLLIGSHIKNEGTCMINPAVRNPFIVNVPGVENDLDYRYNINPVYWLNPLIFSYKPNNIKEISVRYGNSLKHSFKLEIFPDKAKLIDLSNNVPISDINLKKVGSWLSYFMNVKFSSETSDTEKLKNDLLQSDPFAEITVKDINAISKNVKLYKIKNPETGVFDLNKLYAIINNEDVVIVKYIDFDLILKDIKYFQK